MVDLSGKEYYHHIQTLPTEQWRKMKCATRHNTQTTDYTSIGNQACQNKDDGFLINRHAQGWLIREIPTVSSSFRKKIERPSATGLRLHQVRSQVMESNRHGLSGELCIMTTSSPLLQSSAYFSLSTYLNTVKKTRTT